MEFAARQGSGPRGGLNSFVPVAESTIFSFVRRRKCSGPGLRMCGAPMSASVGPRQHRRIEEMPQRAGQPLVAPVWRGRNRQCSLGVIREHPAYPVIRDRDGGQAVGLVEDRSVEPALSGWAAS